MRLSTDKADPGYEEWQRLQLRGEHAKILLDGTEVEHCYTADDQEGFVKRGKLDADGKIFAIDDQIATEIVHGKVEITFEKKS